MVKTNLTPHQTLIYTDIYSLYWAPWLFIKGLVKQYSSALLSYCSTTVPPHCSLRYTSTSNVARSIQGSSSSSDVSNGNYQLPQSLSFTHPYAHTCSKFTKFSILRSYSICLHLLMYGFQSFWMLKSPSIVSTRINQVRNIYRRLQKCIKQIHLIYSF